MTTPTLKVLCSNCGGDTRVAELEADTTACPWCGLSFDDNGTPAGEVGPVFLHVVA